METRKSLGKGFLAGAIGGALGTVALNLFQEGSLAATRATEQALDRDETYTRQQQQLLDSFERAHIRTAEVTTHAAGVNLSSDGRKQSAPVVEFVFGIVCGGVYGALAEYIPAVTAGFGATYGAVLFTGASEVVLPAIGFVPPPTQRTAVQHAGGLSGNVVYGMCTEAFRRLFRD